VTKTASRAERTHERRSNDAGRSGCDGKEVVLSQGLTPRPARKTMIIFDLDLDFFLYDIVIGFGRVGRGRPNKRYYKPWAEDHVRRFLEDKCKLSTHDPCPGKIVVEHDEAFFDWRERILSGEITPPFSVIHIDAHADLGMGDSAYMYLATDLLGRSPAERLYPKTDRLQGLLPGNYLLFAIACHWIDRLVYVYHPRGGRDVPEHIMRNHDLSSGHIQLKYYGQGAHCEKVLSPRSSPIHTEPEVEFTMVQGEEFEAKQPFDLAYLSQSPRYCPRPSDALMAIIGEYIDTRSPKGRTRGRSSISQ